MAAKRVDNTPKRPIRPPAKTIEGRENQLIAAAVDLAEKQIAEGTASAQVITHFLKLGTTRERLEQAKLEADVKLQMAKIQQIDNAAEMATMFQAAMDAMRGYSGADSTTTDFDNGDYDVYED